MDARQRLLAPGELTLLDILAQPDGRSHERAACGPARWWLHLQGRNQLSSGQVWEEVHEGAEGPHHGLHRDISRARRALLDTLAARRTGVLEPESVLLSELLPIQMQCSLHRRT